MRTPALIRCVVAAKVPTRSAHPETAETIPPLQFQQQRGEAGREGLLMGGLEARRRPCEHRERVC